MSLALALSAAVLLAVASQGGAQPLQPRVEVEEDVYTYEAADNGAGPMWCHGSTCLARIGERVFASGLETIPDQKPLNNCRWMLFTREADGWRQLLKDETGRTREPCPVAGFPDGRLFLSANPTLTEPGTYGGPARPEVLQFSAAAPDQPFETLLPTWDGAPEFTEHSYRSFAADGPAGELIIFQNIGYTHAEWSFRDREGNWSAQGKLMWPWGAEYDKPQPIRVCYPNVALKDRAVYFCGVSDIVEPYDAWRAYKKELTGRDWDFDFRRLFLAWCPDITKGEFAEWVEVASRDKTCGWIFPCDLWVAPDGAVHILWTERALDERLREKFFPEEKQRHQLNYAIVRDGKVETRVTLQESGEGLPGPTPGNGRFHITPDNRLLVIYFVSGSNPDGAAFAEDRLLEILPDGSYTPPVTVPLSNPFTSFFTATPRAGSAPSNTLDLLGECRNTQRTVRYARVVLP
ncbi:MAG: hypothetical protein FJX74_00630 [Armatimonadetes bacterium]|nr:hypothetical protein [Armatimonadota bacterium]